MENLLISYRAAVDNMSRGTESLVISNVYAHPTACFLKCNVPVAHLTVTPTTALA